MRETAVGLLDQLRNQSDSHAWEHFVHLYKPLLYGWLRRFSFTGGKYLTWNVSGHIQLRITNLVNGSNGVVNGLFFDATGGAKSGRSAKRTNSSPGSYVSDSSAREAI